MYLFLCNKVLQMINLLLFAQITFLQKIFFCKFNRPPPKKIINLFTAKISKYMVCYKWQHALIRRMHTISPWLLLELAFKYTAGRVVSLTHTTLIFRSSGPNNVVTAHVLKNKREYNFDGISSIHMCPFTNRCTFPHANFTPKCNFVMYSHALTNCV